ncbi:MAG TPA: hypothetical protein VK760_05815, partial [Candidatus Acidoferrales bacterium]|nr:hypothetical protein [Candidatus Acidoferrales bacterium]
MFHARRVLALPLAAGLVLAGCSNAGPAGSGRSGLVPATSPAAVRGRTTTTLTIHIPKRVRGRLHAHFVSPSTQSASIFIAPNAGCTACTPALTQKIGLTAGSKSCATNATGVTCTIVFVLKPGSYTGSMTTYDGALNASGNPTGSALSEAQSFPLNVISGKANAPAIS